MLKSYLFFFLMLRPTPRSKRTDTLFPYPPLFRSPAHRPAQRYRDAADGGDARGDGAGGTRRRRLWRGSDRQGAGSQGGGPARQGGRAVRLVRHPEQPARRAVALGARRGDRKSVVEGKSVAGLVDLVGRRINNKQKK